MVSQSLVIKDSDYSKQTITTSCISSTFCLYVSHRNSGRVQLSVYLVLLCSIQQ